MSWRTRIKEKIAVKREELRDIWSMGIVWLWNDLRTNARAQFRRTENWIGELRTPPDQKRFATTPPAWWAEKKQGGSIEAPKTPNVKGTKIYDEKGNAKAVAMDLTMFENDGENPTHFEAEVLFSDIVNRARGGESEITPEERYEMHHYSANEKLTNEEDAKAIKKHWLLGKSGQQIADATGIKLSRVNKHTACFERAKKHSPTDGESKSD